LRRSSRRRPPPPPPRTLSRRADARLRRPPPPLADSRLRIFNLPQAARGLGVEVRPDAGGGKGRGLFATRRFAAGELLFTEAPLLAIQHSANRVHARVCAHCLRFVGSVEQQLALRGAALAGGGCGDDGASGSGGGGARIDPAELAQLASGATRLPLSEAVPLPPALVCVGGCGESYCGERCRAAAWARHHSLLCAGAAAGPGAAALRAFNAHADATNDVFRLAAQAAAATLLAAAARLPVGAAPPSLPAAERWAALRAAWLPLQAGHKAVWWECVTAPADAGDEAAFRAGLRALAAESLELLDAALRARAPPLAAAFPAALRLEPWGALVGMFELNNLAVYVAGPVPRWAAAVEALPAAASAAAEAAGGAALAAAGGLVGVLDNEEAWACDGNAFYSLQATCNHSCAPAAHAFKRDGDDDGAAVLLALRELAAGEEVTIAYVDEEAPAAERAAALADYGFACACDKCAADELAAELEGG
jgi:hypothetical protein